MTLMRITLVYRCMAYPRTHTHTLSTHMPECMGGDYVQL